MAGTRHWLPPPRSAARAHNETSEEGGTARVLVQRVSRGRHWTIRGASSRQWRVFIPVLQGGGARLLTLPVSVLANLLGARLLLEYGGSATYGAVLLVATLATLIPFAELGLGAPVMSEVAAALASADRARLLIVVSRSRRLLMLSGGVLFALVGVVTLSHAWARILGGAASVRGLTTVAPLAMMLIAIAVPIGLAERILIGLGRTHMAVLTTLASPLVALSWIALVVSAEMPVATAALGLPLGTLCSGLLNVALARREICRADWRLPHSGEPRRAPLSLHRQAVPMLVMTVSLPLALQSDRLLLAHRSTADELSAYALAFQIYAPAIGAAHAAATALWSMGTNRRTAQRSYARLWRGATSLFFALGLLTGLIIGFLGPAVLRLLGSETHVVSGQLLWLFATLTLVQTVMMPSTMLLTSEAGLRFQAKTMATASLVNVSLSWLLAAPLGARGPVIASILSLLFLQVIPLAVVASRGRT